jgi:hypothetical protein
MAQTCGGQLRLSEYKFVCAGPPPPSPPPPPPSPSPPSPPPPPGSSTWDCVQLPFVDPVCQSNPKNQGKYPDLASCEAKCLAPHPAPSGSGGKNGLTVGSILLIVVFCALVIPYFVIGMLYMKFHEGASGADLVPNKAFWVSLPGLIADGFGFVAAKMTRKDYQPL